MPHVARHYRRALGFVIGNGHCVALVRECAGLPATQAWRPGVLVRGADPPLTPGTVIATFDADGRYGNHTDGRSHAAIFLKEAPYGLLVVDQWIGQPVHQRVIRFPRDPVHPASPVNDGSQYFTIELAPPGDP